MNEPRSLAKLAGTAQRIAEGMSALQRIAETGDVELMIRRQALAVVEEYDLLRFYLRESTLRGAIEAPAVSGPAPAATPRAARKSAATGKAIGGHARAAKLSPSKRSAIARKAAKARWKP
jgi:hypothetical protein